MNTVWVFGDSYAVDHGQEWQWFKQYAKLKGKEYKTKADYGVANSWISMQVFEHYHNKVFQPGDSIIVVTTHCIRHWFLWDHPNVSNYQNMTHLDPNHFGINKEQIHAIELYYKHIQSGYQDSFLYDANTAWLNHYAELFQQQGIEMIIIQGFPNATDIQPKGARNIKGSLFDSVCSLEFKSQKHMDEWYERDVPDQRVNHMCKDNHQVFALALADQQDIELNSLPWRKNLLSVSTEALLKDQLSPKLLR